MPSWEDFPWNPVFGSPPNQLVKKSELQTALQLEGCWVESTDEEKSRNYRLVCPTVGVSPGSVSICKIYLWNCPLFVPAEFWEITRWWPALFGFVNRLMQAPSVDTGFVPHETWSDFQGRHSRWIREGRVCRWYDWRGGAESPTLQFYPKTTHWPSGSDASQFLPLQRLIHFRTAQCVLAVEYCALPIFKSLLDMLSQSPLI